MSTVSVFKEPIPEPSFSFPLFAFLCIKVKERVRERKRSRCGVVHRTIGARDAIVHLMKIEGVWKKKRLSHAQLICEKHREQERQGRIERDMSRPDRTEDEVKKKVQAKRG